MVQSSTQTCQTDDNAAPTSGHPSGCVLQDREKFRERCDPSHSLQLERWTRLTTSAWTSHYTFEFAHL